MRPIYVVVVQRGVEVIDACVFATQEQAIHYQNLRESPMTRVFIFERLF